MTAQILFMKDEPLISTYNYYASITSIFAEEDGIWPWFYSSCIQYCYDEKHDWFFFENHNLLDTCEYLERTKISRELASKGWDTVIQLLMDAIDNGNYCYFLINRYYLPGSIDYQKNHGSHEIFVYGYDKEKKIVYYADHLSSGKYIKTTCTFDEMDKAYNLIPTDDWIYICMYKKIPRDYDCVNMDYVKKSLECLLEGKPSIETPTGTPWWNCTYGISIYDILIKKLEISHHLDKRPYHLLWEHKKCMTLRLEYMIKQGLIRPQTDILEEYTLLEKDYLTLRNIALKYNLSQNEKLRDKLISLVGDYKEREQLAASRLLTVLNGETGCNQ
jgi:hypothetical protein